MGSGYHGGFGDTLGKKYLYKNGRQNYIRANYTKEQLLESIEGKTKQATKIANSIRNGRILMSVIGNELFDRAFGVNSNVIGLAIENKIYLRRDSISIYSDMIHEGTHALDYTNGIEFNEISSYEGEMRAFKAEHEFQKAVGIKPDFKNEEEIKVYVLVNYGKKGR